MELEAGKLEQVLDFLEDNPKVHNQQEWICGTSGCIAGWTVALFDYELSAGDKLSNCMTECGVSRRAAEILGLTREQEIALFIDTTQSCRPEVAAIRLGRALIAQSKGELTGSQRAILSTYLRLRTSR